MVTGMIEDQQRRLHAVDAVAVPSRGDAE
jgi:hypothetical protein